MWGPGGVGGVGNVNKKKKKKNKEGERDEGNLISGNCCEKWGGGKGTGKRKRHHKERKQMRSQEAKFRGAYTKWQKSKRNFVNGP